MPQTTERAYKLRLDLPQLNCRPSNKGAWHNENAGCAARVLRLQMANQPSKERLLSLRF